jgi:hypothetical protein
MNSSELRALLEEPIEVGSARSKRALQAKALGAMSAAVQRWWRGSMRLVYAILLLIIAANENRGRLPGKGIF